MCEREVGVEFVDVFSTSDEIYSLEFVEFGYLISSVFALLIIYLSSPHLLGKHNERSAW